MNRTPPSYTAFIQSAKKFANQGESQRLNLMKLLLDTEPRKSIAKLKTEFRGRVVRETQSWIDSHRVRPTYQRITKYVSELKKDMGIRSRPSTPIHALRSENTRLKRELNKANDYIDTLQATLKKHQIRVPREP